MGCSSWDQPLERNTDFQIWQTCNNCTYCNFTFFTPSDNFGVDYEAATENNWRYYNNLSSDNSSELGVYRYDYKCGNAFDVEVGCVEFKVTPTGDFFDSSQSIALLGQSGLMILFLALGFSFRKEKWKIKTFFFIIAILMGLIGLNSLNIALGTSEGLHSMGQMGLIIGIVVVSFMVAWFLIMMTIETLSYFKKQKKDKWEMRDYE